jgi:hypothetical protein
MRHLETLKGQGTVVSSSGERVAVRYTLQVYQSEIDASSLTTTGTIPGLKTIEGTIQPVCFFGENGLTLELADGRTAKFLFMDGQGSVHVNWLG